MNYNYIDIHVGRVIWYDRIISGNGKIGHFGAGKTGDQYQKKKIIILMHISV